MARSDVETRATRLGVSILTFGVVGENPHDAIEGTHACRLIKRDEWQAWRESDDADLDLANACLEIEREQRDREWNAIELLDLARHAPDVELPAAVEANDAPEVSNLPPISSVVLVPRDQLAAVATVALGWHLAAPEGE